MLIKVGLLFLVAFLAYMQDFLGTTFIGRPLVSGWITGLVLGAPVQGLVMGAVLELVWMGLMEIGAAISLDIVAGGILGIALAVWADGNIGFALLFALPASILGGILENFFYSKINSAYCRRAKEYIDRGQLDKGARMHIAASLFHPLAGAAMVALLFGMCAGWAQNLASFLPPTFLHGLSVAAMLLPAVGFATLLGMMLNKKTVPFFFLGFILAAALGLSMTAIVMIGCIAGGIMFILLSEIHQNTSGKEAPADEDF